MSYRLQQRKSISVAAEAGASPALRAAALVAFLLAAMLVAVRPAGSRMVTWSR